MSVLSWPLHSHRVCLYRWTAIHLLSFCRIVHVIAARHVGNLSSMSCHLLLLSSLHLHLWRRVVRDVTLHRIDGVCAGMTLDCLQIFFGNAATNSAHWRDTWYLVWRIPVARCRRRLCRRLFLFQNLSSRGQWLRRHHALNLGYGFLKMDKVLL